MTKNNQTFRTFRGRNSKNNTWLYGYYFVNRGKSYIVQDGIADNPLDTPEDYEVVLESVGQSTGLSDKNGVEIYEGDIIRYDGRGQLAEVKYRDGGYKKVGEGIYEPLYSSALISGRWEIIANIYENPELLSD